MASKIKVFRGVSYDILYNHRDALGNATPLTGHTLYFTVKPVEYDSDALDSSAKIQKTITNHVDVLGAPSDTLGVSFFTLTDADTQIDVGEYYFDVVIEQPNGKSLPPSLIGTFEVLPKTTNRNV